MSVDVSTNSGVEENCNVPKRGWMAGIGGCPNVGGICIGCTMPGFPDKFMPLMDAPPGGGSSTAMAGTYGPLIRKLRGITNRTMDKETKWRHNRWSGRSSSSNRSWVTCCATTNGRAWHDQGSRRRDRARRGHRSRRPQVGGARGPALPQGPEDVRSRHACTAPR